MNRLKTLNEIRGAKFKELDALRVSADKRSLNTEERTKFDTLAVEIEGIDSDIARENRAAGLTRQENSELGLSKSEKKRYSLLRACNLIAQGKPLDGFELEVSTAEEKRCERERNASGFFVPSDILGRNVRALQATDVTLGGSTVDSDVMFENMVPLLRNATKVLELGGRVISGLTGNYDIPRVLTGTTVAWLNENGQVTQSNPTFGQIALKPRRLAASGQYTRQFMAQSGLDADAFFQDDINRQFAVELDRVAINGSGGSQPLGILNQASTDLATAVTFGASATWAKAVLFEGNVESQNALLNEPAYLTTPNAKAKWKTIQKAANNAIYLWETPDNTCNGYRARASLNVPSDLMIFGDFSQVIFGEWLGNQIIVDPYTGARSSLVNITIEKQMDMVIRQTKSFCVSTDSAAQ